ncbi:9309_t:CDS:1, partial [Cetraspora pellucida]
LGSWHIKELKNNIQKKGNELIENFKSLIINEKNDEKLKKYFESLKNINSFFLKDKNEFLKEIESLEINLKIVKETKIDSNILKNRVSIIFKPRKNNSIKLKPIYFPFGYSTKKSINLIIERYNKVVEKDIEINNHIYKLIFKNIKSYKESFYTQPWKSIIHN